MRYYLAFVVLLAAPALHAKPKELITLILVDALRPDHMGSYGYPKNTTPNLDKLAKESTRYTRMYVNAPWTRPSTASFLTGLNASRHRTETYKTKLPEDVTTLAQRLRKAGWHTAGFCANGNGGSLAGLHKGFHIFKDPTNTYTKKVRGKTFNGLPTGPFIVDDTLDFLRKSTADKQFLFMFLVDPHDPYYAPKELEARFLGDYKGKVRRHALWEANNDYPPNEVKSMLAIYDAAIFYADQALGRFFSELKKMGLYDKATIFLTADHGEGFGEHDFYLHAHHFWEEVIKVPLLAKGPKFQAGKVSDRLTQAIDVSATIANIAGARPSGMAGFSLLGDQAAPHVISEYNEFGIHRQAIIGQKHKVIWQRPADEEWYMREAKKKEYFPSVSFDKEVIRVFDLVADPQEKENLVHNTPEQAAKLLETLRNFVEPKGS